MANTIGTTPEINYEKKSISHEQLQCEVDYVRAQRILDSLLQNGLISLSEFNNITLLNSDNLSLQRWLLSCQKNVDITVLQR